MADPELTAALNRLSEDVRTLAAEGVRIDRGTRLLVLLIAAASVLTLVMAISGVVVRNAIRDCVDSHGTCYMDTQRARDARVSTARAQRLREARCMIISRTVPEFDRCVGP